MKKLITILFFLIATGATGQIIINGSNATDTTVIHGSIFTAAVTVDGTTPELSKWDSVYGCGNPVHVGPSFSMRIIQPTTITVCIYDITNINGIMDSVYIGFQTLNITPVDPAGIDENMQADSVSVQYFELLGRTTSENKFYVKNRKIYCHE